MCWVPGKKTFERLKYSLEFQIGPLYFFEAEEWNMRAYNHNNVNNKTIILLIEESSTHKFKHRLKEIIVNEIKWRKTVTRNTAQHYYIHVYSIITST